MPDKLTIKVEGMSCGHCKMAVENALKKIDGVLEVNVSLEGKSAEIDYDANKTKKEEMIKVISEEGYKAS